MTGDDVQARKRAAAERAAALVSDGMVLGLGTGSTASLAIEALGRRVQAGLRISGVPSSRATERLAQQVGLPLISLDERPRLDLTIDGADEVDRSLNLIKGAGGALLREKVLAGVSAQLVIIVDDSKLVTQLGQRSALPVEVTPFALPAVLSQLAEHGQAPTARRQAGELVMTDNGNYLIDCQTGPLADQLALAQWLNNLPGVVDHGLFLGLTSRVIVGRPSGVSEYLAGQAVDW